MNCLKDYIGIRGCGAAPESGQFINSLQGISLKSIQLVSDSEQVTFVKVWEDVQERAWLRLSNDFMLLMRTKYCITEAGIDTDAFICADKALFTRVWMYVLAAELMQEQLYSERINKLTTIDRDRSVELHAYFTQLYNDALENVLPAIAYTTGAEVLSEKFTRVERLP